MAVEQRVTDSHAVRPSLDVDGALSEVRSAHRRLWRRRRRNSAVVVFAMSVAAIGLGIASVENASTDVATGPVDQSATTEVEPRDEQIFGIIELPAPSVASGGSIDVTFRVRNRSGAPKTAISCGGLFYAVLAPVGEPPPPVARTLCAQTFSVPEGESVYPLVLDAHVQSCSSDPSSTGTDVPRCEPDGGMPPLPPGEYEVVIDGPFGELQMPVPDREQIRVTD